MNGGGAWIRTVRGVVALVAGLVLIGACANAGDEPDATDAPEVADGTGTADGSADDSDAGSGATDGQRYPDVVEAALEPAGDAWRLSATLSSPYDSPERYADAFRALTTDGEELGVRELLHDHANEQPFTRSFDGLSIPDDVEVIVVEGRDLEHGWGGETVEVEVPDVG